LLPDVFYAPRGLTTIVLMLGIPAALRMPSFSQGVLFFVVMLSTIVMTVGSIFFTPKSARREQPEDGPAETLPTAAARRE
ncbi:MAG TPA: hypothetical protein VFQ96_01735, partial [Microbacteriaceae bacterium]|nr:hypothetical protein [Microbacteriaceae bacterium]